ncbi:MAG TPA: LuxR C-terminal-related transcriptional regulator [Candidatus Angelobacter sp.]
MDEILVLANSDGIPDGVLLSLRVAGWRATVTTELASARQLLQKRGFSGLMVQIGQKHDPELLGFLQFVHQSSPETMVISLRPELDAFAQLKPVLGAQPSTATSQSGGLFKRLTPAQKAVAMLVGQGYSNKQIAAQLEINRQSVRNVLCRTFKTLGVQRRLELALLANQARREDHTPGLLHIA